jgi:hypothetical protein
MLFLDASSVGNCSKQDMDSTDVLKYLLLSLMLVAVLADLILLPGILKTPNLG